MQLHINPHDGRPVYRQIERQIAAAIAERRLRPGETLLPEREMAARLVVSPASVRKAYERLQTDGLCRRTAADGLRVLAAGSGPGPSGRAARALARRKRELLAEELESARAAQQRLLPPSHLEEGPWVVEARSYPAGTLSGDFYDVFGLDDGGLGVVVADVVGKGLAAGLLMAAAKSMLGFMTRGREAGAVLTRLNRQLRPLLARREFIALAYARLDPQQGIVELANAGLPEPYLLGSGGQVKSLPVPGPRLPLGLREQVRYATARYRNAPGDRLLLTTDGIPEARDPEGEPVGYEGFAKLIRSMPRAVVPSRGSSAPARWLDQLLDRVRDRTSPLPEDDWTAVLVERRGAAR